MDENPKEDEKAIERDSQSPNLNNQSEEPQNNSEKLQENSNNNQNAGEPDQTTGAASEIKPSIREKKLLNKLFEKITNSKEKIVNIWQNLSKKHKILVSLLILIVFINVAAFIVLGKFGKGLNIKENFNRLFESPITTETQIQSLWKKLKIPQREAPFFSLKPTIVSRFGILPQEKLILAAKEKVDIGFIRQNIKTSIPVAVNLKTDQEIIISPQSPLGKDQYFKVKLAVGGLEYNGHTFDRDYSWAFQTQGKFRVVSHIPGDKKTKVPLNTSIELTFSQDDFQDPSQFIQIYPSVPYKLERHDETLAIVPQEKLKAKTVYKVTLKGGLNLKSRNDPILEDFVFSFQTDEELKQKATSRLNLDKTLYQSSTQEPLKIKVFTSNWKKESKVLTKVYKFPSVGTFLETRKNIDSVIRGWYGYYPEEEKISTENLELTSQVELEVKQEDRISYLQLPEPLSAGYYYLRFTYEDSKKIEQLWLNVTDIAGYVIVGKNDTTIWVNDVVSGNPVVGANVALVGTDIGSTSNDRGIVTLTTPSNLFEKSNHYFQITSTDNKSLVLPVSSLNRQTPPGKVTKDDYWAYIYNERLLYHPTDTVYFWGVVKRRDDGQVPESITIALNKSSYYRDTSGSLNITQTINPQPDGSFMGSIPLQEIPENYYYLYLKIGDVDLDSTGFRVKEFTKPELKIEAFSSKKAIFTDEKVEFTANVSFYDDTPATDIPLKIHETRTAKVTETNSDKNGQIKYVYKPAYQKSSQSNYQGITITPALAQEAKVEGNVNVRVFGNKLMITTESKQDGGTAFIKAIINKVDLTQINSGISQNVKGDLVSNQKVNLKITKTWYEKISKGTYYDYIEKVTRPAYEYIRHSDEVFNNNLYTNSQGSVEHSFNLEEQKSYEAVVTTGDEDNHTISKSRYFYYRQSYYSPRRGGSAGTYPQLLLNKEENDYSLGENVEANISLGGEAYPDTDKNRFLFIIAQRGKQEISVRDSPNFSFQFSQRHVPNVSLGAVIFTGKAYQLANPSCRYDWYCRYSYEDYFYFNGLSILYKKEDKELKLELQVHKNKYQPGETAKVTVKVSDKQGNPVKSSVNLVLVDEALEALGAIRIPKILPEVYRTVANQIYYNYYSHKPVLPPESVAEMGGGGGERELFKDTAFFGQQTTNEQGEALFEFKLPDNITTWKIFTQAVSNNLSVGQEDASIVVSKDFFVLPHFPRTFLVEDKPLLLASSFGTGVDSSTQVNYSAEFFKDDQQLSKLSKKGLANTTTNFSFPNLAAGDYKLTLNGKAEKFEDGVKLPFAVSETNFVLNRHQYYNLNAGDQFNSLGTDNILTNLPVKLIISDEGKGKYYYQIRNFCYTSSNRIEKKIAAKVASNILKEKFDDDSCKIKPEELSIFQYSDGGLSLVRWGGSHLETTVWSTYVDASVFDKQKLIEFYKTKLNEPKSGTVQKILAAWGLITLDQPEINTLSYLSNTAATFKEKAFMALAYASAGETEKAREIYYDILADYAYEMSPYIRIQTELGKNKTGEDEYLKDTSIALLLGSMVVQDYDKGLYAYLRDHRNLGRDVVLDLSQMAFIEEELEKLPDEFTEIKFNSPDRELIRELTKGGRFVVQLKPVEQNNFTVNILSGKTELTTSYFIGKDSVSSVKTDDRLKITRSYQNAKNPGNVILPGDIVKVTLDFDIDRDKSPKGSYLISDLLPAGLIYLNNPDSYGLEVKIRPFKVSNNNIQFRVYNSDWWYRYYGTRIEYYTRVGAAGEFIGEPALLQSWLEPSVVAFTPSDMLQITTRNE